MAERRMFSKTIIDSDLFMDLPLTAQALYFHLSMRADDDGFIGNSKKLCRMLGVGEEDLALLIEKELLIKFDSGVVAVKHWKEHNKIRKDRYKATIYLEEKKALGEESGKLENEEIEPEKASDNQVATKWQPNDNQMATQVRLGKDSIGKDSLDKDSLDYISPSGDIAASAASSASAEQTNKVDFSFSSASAEQPTQNSYSAPSALPKADRGDSITMPKAKSSINRNSGAPKYPKKAESPSDDLDRYLHPKFENMPKKGRSGGFDYKEAWEAALARSGIEYE